MQAKKFRATALYFFVFRAECSLVISLFPKDFYPITLYILAGGCSLIDFFLKKSLCAEYKAYICDRN